MTYLLQTLIIGLGLIIYLRKPKWFFFYWMSIIPIIFPLFCLGTMLLDREVFTACQNTLKDAGRNLFLLLFLIEYAKQRKIPVMGKVYHILFILMLYILIQGFILHPDVIYLWPELSELLSLLLPLVFMIMRPDMIPSPKFFFNYLFFIILIQILGVILNINGIHTYLTFYVPYDYLLGNGVSYFGEEGLAMGTFPDSGALSNFCSTILLFFSLEYFSRRDIQKIRFVAIAIVLFFLILCSGIRVSLTLSFFIIWVSSLFYIKKHSFLFLSATIVVILGYVLFLSVDIKSIEASEINDGMKRQVVGLAKAIQASESSETGTTGLSAYLIDNYFYNSPIIGNGLAHKGDFAYGNWGSVALTGFKADSRLALILVEYGIVGMAFYLAFFLSIVLYLGKLLAKHERKKLVICFVYYFLLTIVDPGFFDRFNFPLMYLFVLSVLDRKPIVNKIHLERNNNKMIYAE